VLCDRPLRHCWFEYGQGGLVAGVVTVDVGAILCGSTLPKGIVPAVLALLL
jgi:hypothetical protein